MTTTTPSPVHDRRPRARGFTMVEIIIGSTIAAFVLTGVITTFLFIGRSTTNIVNYAEMEAQARAGLEQFAQDTRQASDMAWTSANTIELTVAGAAVTYTYDSGAGTLSRTTGGATNVLVEDISTLSLSAYMITGVEIDLSDLSTAAKRTAASDVTKQIQIYLVASRTSTTVATATNTVLSARFILRNKRVTT